MTTNASSAHERSRTTGLYDPAFEHDACGIALVADLQGRRSHALVRQAVTALEHLAHRGATGAEVATGDGAGILVQVPHRFLTGVIDFALPEPGGYAVGMVFLPVGADDADKAEKRIGDIAGQEGLAVLGWRDVPVDASSLGASAVRAMPRIRQVVLAPDPARGFDPLTLDRMAFCVRKRVEHEVPGVYLPSLSARTIVYKGMLTGHQLSAFYADLADERFDSGLALVHSRFSTNTFPSWPLAHPYRFLAHNGEINTLRGNRNWMRAREALLDSAVIPGDLERLYPVCDPEGSDSASFDEVLELLHLGGRSLAHAVLMMIPEAWENHATMDESRRAFYRFHASLMEPWDGPAAVVFTDGTVAGAVLDRNGLRPARYWVTDEGLVV
ncbi:MAG TPA: glutamate synthase subunit alpha, partial [Acidimicrobiales bacterium]|nr:glutamate synthase subunit alpha [Acidimicrobiales bacterium]